MGKRSLTAGMTHSEALAAGANGSSGGANDILSLISEVRVSRPADLVADQLLGLITKGRLKPGSLLPPERELTKKFGISRNHVREGIKTLELYGLLKPTQGKGTEVTELGIRGLEGVLKRVLKLTRGDLLALADTRTLLETEAARLAAENAEPEGRAELELLLAELKSSGSLADDIRLHLKIADMSRNPVLASLIRLIAPDIVTHYRDLRNDDSAGSFEIHRQIAESVAAGDSARAAGRMREHLSGARDNFRKALERRHSGRLAGG